MNNYTLKLSSPREYDGKVFSVSADHYTFGDGFFTFHREDEVVLKVRDHLVEYILKESDGRIHGMDADSIWIDDAFIGEK